MYCTQNVYAQADFYLVSVLVIDDTSQAVPVLQALSATDPTQTAISIMETLKSSLKENSEQGEEEYSSSTGKSARRTYCQVMFYKFFGQKKFRRKQR